MVPGAAYLGEGHLLFTSGGHLLFTWVGDSHCVYLRGAPAVHLREHLLFTLKGHCADYLEGTPAIYHQGAPLQLALHLQEGPCEWCSWVAQYSGLAMALAPTGHTICRLETEDPGDMCMLADICMWNFLVLPFLHCNFKAANPNSKGAGGILHV